MTDQTSDFQNDEVYQCAQVALLVIMIICQCDLYPLTPHFYIVKLGFTGVFIISSPEPKAQR